MKTTAFFLSILFTLFSCTKDKETETQDQLPPITTTGANTAGCIINGKVLIPKNGSPSLMGTTAKGLKKSQGNNFYPDKNDYWQLQISNNKDSNNNFGLVLWIKNMSPGNNNYIVGQSNGEIDDNGPDNNQIIAGIKTDGINKTYFSSVNSGVIKILRSDLGFGISIFSGTFSCILYNKDNVAETIEIKDGRFDINGLTLNQ